MVNFLIATFQQSRNLFLAIFLLCFSFAHGQVYQSMPQAGYGPVKRMLFDSVLTLPIGINGLRNITGGKDTAQIRYNKSDSSVYVFSGTQWIKVASGGADSSVFFTKFRSDTMRANVYNAIANVPTPTLQHAYDVSGYPQIIYDASKNFAIKHSDNTDGLYFNNSTKDILLGDSTKVGSYLNINTGADITLNTPSEIILNPDSAQTGYVWTAKNANGHGEWRAASSGNGTVTSVATGYGLSGGTITTSGTLTVDTSVSGLSGKYLRISDTTNKFLSAVSQPNDSSLTFTKGGTTSTFIIRSAIAGSATRLVTTVYNNSGATIAKGSVVYISGRHSSNLPTIELATGNTEANSYKTFALADANISNNSSGIVIQAGNITGLNLPTSSFTDGDIVYLSPTVPGGITITKPLAPNHICKIGSVTRAHPTFGSIEIKIENGWQLDELSDVQIAAVPADSVLLQFSRTDSLWHDRTITQAFGNYLNAKQDTSTTWKTSGNFEVNAGQFIGSRNNASVRFRVNNFEHIVLDSTRKLIVDSLTIGRGSGRYLTNAAFGIDALNSNSIGLENTAIGAFSLNRNLVGSSNTAVGAYSNFRNNEGGRNTAIGNNANYENTAGNEITAIGYNSLSGNKGEQNTSVGSNSLYTNKTGAFNTGVGASVLYNNESGSYNTAIGAQAGQYYGSGVLAMARADSSIFIGNLSRAAADLQNNQIVIGVNAIGNGSNSVVLGNDRITSTVLKGVVNAPSLRLTDSIVLTSTVGGISLPNMTQTQMNAIVPRLGTQVYNTTYDAICSYTRDFGWWSHDPAWLTANGFMINDEFITYAYNSNQNGNFFQIQNSNGTWTSATPISNRPGILQMSTGTSAAGRLTVQADGIGLASNIVGGGKLVYETDVQIPTLSSATQTFSFFTGFSSTNTNVSTNSIAFLYDSSGTNTGSSAIGRWQVVCANGSVRSYTTTDSTVTAGRWYRLRAEINAAGNSVSFFINGTLVKTETNNIPTGATTAVSSLIKTVGTTARTAWVDFIRIRQKFTTPR